MCLVEFTHFEKKKKKKNMYFLHVLGRTYQFDHSFYLKLPRQYKKKLVCEENLHTSRQLIYLSQSKLMNY